MPFVIAIEPGHGVTRVRFSGSITGLDIISATDELIANPDYDETFDQLWVLTDVASLSISPEEMTALVAHDQELVETGEMGHVRVAIVINGEVRELAIMLYQHQMRNSGQDIRLFDHEEAAESWLREAHRQSA